MKEVWTREASQRAGRFHFEVLTTSDGMVSQYRRTQMDGGYLVTQNFRGEMSCQAAMRQFTDDVLKEVHR